MSVVAVHSKSVGRLSVAPGHGPVRSRSSRDGSWPEAAPFRAHVVHVLSSSGLSTREFAALSRVSVRLIRRLISGREGRPMRRIDPLSAHRLLAVTALDASLVRARRVPASGARAHALILRQQGRSLTSLARLTGLGPAQLALLLDDRLSLVPQLCELRLAAAVTDLEAGPQAPARLPDAA